MKNFLKLAGIVIVVFISLHLVYADTTSGLVAHWKFDDGSGTSATDSSGNSNSGTLINGPTWTTGKIGGGLKFNGVNSYVSTGGLTNKVIPAANAPQTMAVWFKGNDGCLVSSHNDPNSFSSAIDFCMGWASLIAHKYGGANLVAANTINLQNVWHHAVYTFDGTYHRIYLDGELAATDTVAPNTASTDEVDIGVNSNTMWGPFDGIIDDVRIYNRALSAAEIQQLYNPLSQGNNAAAKQVYYSVGQNTSDHKTGSPTVTISSGIAEFSVAQTAGNIGVGDRVTYNGTQKVFISGKISQAKWTVVTVKGDTPANVTNATVNSIRHEFDSLNNAISYYKGKQAGDANHLGTLDLVAGNYVLNIPLYYDTGPEYFTGGQFVGAILIQSFNTGPNNYIRIYTPNNTASEVNLSQRHDGKWNNQKYSLIFNPDRNSTAAIRTYDPYVKIDGLQIKIISSYHGNYGIEASYINNGWVEFSNNIITGQILNYAAGIYIGYADTNVSAKIWNNLIYDLRGTNYGSSSGIIYGSCYNISCVSGIGYLYNNTIINIPYGISNNSPEAKIVAKNNIVQEATIGYYEHAYSGYFDPTSSNNISHHKNGNKNDAPGSNPQNNTVVSFVDKAGKDFHLSPSDNKAQNEGVSLLSDQYLPISSDFDGNPRPSGGAWDIGADEISIPQGNIVISATLDGEPWPASGSASITYTLSGPSGNISNSTVSYTYSNVPANVNYTLNYVSGGPAGAAIDSISPASSQLLPQNSTIIFTINFKSAPLLISASCSAFPTSITVGESSRWTASASGGTGGPYTYTWSGTDNLSGITNSPVNYIDHTYLSVNINPGHSVSVTVSDGSQSKSATCANTAQVAPVVGADLIGRALGINGNRVPGQAITFSGDVFNLPGKNTSGPSTARICIDNANCLTSSAGSLGEFPISALSANTNSIPLNTSNPWIMTLGTHTYYVCADIYGTNSETDETNNCGSQTFTATECSDGVDNIDPEDNLIDTADPGCHEDADASNPASYNALDDNEANSACSDPFDNDGDGANNCADPGCHTDHNYKNSSSCDPTINNEFYVTQCEDVDALGAPIDNDGDGKANSLDPGCHWDGNVNNPNSYDKYDNSEGDLSFREVFAPFTRPFASLFGF